MTDLGSDATFPPPLTDTSPEGLRAALEADSIGTRVRATDLPVQERLEADASWSVGEARDLYRNVVVSARFDNSTADRRIAEIVATYDALPSPFLWWRAPFHSPADLGERLERAGVFQVGEAPAMAMDLRDLPDAVAVPRGLEIRGVTDEAGLRAYLMILAAESPPAEGAPPMLPPEVVERIVARIGPRLVAEPVPMRYVGWLDGRPVSTARLSLAGGAAGIYSVATLPEARGRGIGAAVTHAALAPARELGYRIGTLQSTEMGYRVYQRLGFVEQFTYAIHVHIPGGARFGAG
jgi:GNAT superfamily N-acetyltransferase